MKNKKKVIVLLVLLVLLAGVVGGLWYFNNHYIILGGIQSRAATELDLSGREDLKIEKLLELQYLKKMDLRDTGITNEDYQQLKSAHPDCDIHWSVPFQGGHADSKSQSLTVTSIADADIAQLAYFTDLQTLDATGCADLPAVMSAIEAYPQLAVSYQVPLQGTNYPHDTAALTLTDVDAAALDTALSYLPDVTKAELQGVLPEAAVLQELTGKYTDVYFFWQQDVLGVEANVETKELTLTDVPTEQIPQVMEALAYLPALERVNLEGTLAEAAALQELTAAYPEIKFYWQIDLFGVPADVDTEELDLSDIPMESVDTVENALPYLPSLKKVIMSNCGISNEDMDALWKRNPEVRFVWTVRIGSLYVRTDATNFMPAKYRKLLKGNEGYNLRYCVDMECLDLGHATIPNCDFVAYMPNLKYLLLCMTNISDISPIANHDKLVYLELFGNWSVRDYTPLLTLTALEDLNICYTYGDIEIIKQMSWLKNLWWSPGDKKPWLSREREKILSEALPNTYLELDTFSSTGEGWRELPHYYEQRDIFEMPYMYT